MTKLTIKYRDGYPTKKSIREAIASFFGDSVYAPRINASYEYTGALIWDRKGINEKIDQFVGFLSDYGVEVKDYRLYDSPTTGAIYLIKKTKNYERRII